MATDARNARHEPGARNTGAVRLAGLVALSLAVAAAESVAQQPPARWTVDAKPTVALGGDDPAALLNVVVGATRLPDGSILVGDRGEFALRIFSPAGAVLKAFARAGAGPGEVRYLGRMFRCGDSVFTNDIQEGQRMSVFSLAGQYARSFRFRSPPGEASAYASACNRNGDFVHIGWEKRGDAKGGIYRSIVAVWTSRADSVVGTVVDSMPGSERWGQVRDNQLRGARPLPLGKQPVIGISRSRLFLGSADRFEVRVDDRAGKPAGFLRRADPPVELTEADVRREREMELANGGANNRARIEQAWAEMSFPKTLPAYTKLIVDASELVWVRPYPREGQASLRWSVFDAAGALIAEVDVPALLDVYEIGADYLLGRYLDPAEGVPQVRQYKLTRGAR